MPKISALPPMTTPVASDDQIPMVDKSVGATKRVDNGDLTGFPDFGWTSSSETWSYSSWSSTTRIGVITVPSDATTKYTPGMRIRITQSTGGTKYGIIHAVSSTTLTVFFPSGTTLNNEAISDSMFAVVKTPFGFNGDPLIWAVELRSNANALQSSPSNEVWYNVGSHTLVIGIGSWNLQLKGNLINVSNSSQTQCVLEGGLSTSNNSVSDSDLIGRGVVYGASSSLRIGAPLTILKPILLASQTTYYLIAREKDGSSASVGFEAAAECSILIKATSGYL